MDIAGDMVNAKVERSKVRFVVVLGFKKKKTFLCSVTR